MAQLNRLATALVATLLAACGGKSLDVGEPDNEGGSHQGGTSGVGASAGSTVTAGTTSKGGTSSVGGSSWGGTGQGGSAGAACHAYDDHAPSYVQVAIINKTSAPIHLGEAMVSCGVSAPFQVNDAAGVPLQELGDCRAACDVVRDHGPIGCPAVCAYPSALTLKPGERHYTTYDGLYEVLRALPTECAADANATMCHQAVAIQPGTFTFVSSAGSALDCSQTTGDAICNPCTPNGNGGCTTPGSLISGKMRQARTTVYLDSSYGVYGLPAPAEYRPYGGTAGASGGAAPLAIVELVFID